MGHKSKNLKMQMNDVLKSKCKFGEPKRNYLKNGEYKKWIFAFNSFKGYKQQCYRFADFCKKYSCKDLHAARSLVDPYLDSLSKEDLSPYSIKTAASALGKLFGCSLSDFIPTPERNDANITRSRNRVLRDNDFNEAKHIDFVTYCKSTGCRAGELAHVKASDLICIDGHYYLDLRHNSGTKGGRPRLAPVLDNLELLKNLHQNANNGLVWPVINSHADVHYYRSRYAQKVYLKYARDCSSLPSDEVYRRRGLHAGEMYDKKALRIASEALGHSRLDVVVRNYFYRFGEDLV